MKLITGKKIIANMLDNKIVSLRKGKYGGISESTRDLLGSILFDYGYKRVECTPLDNGYIEIKLDNDFILSNKVKVY
jgi:hypothetical protein